MSPTRLRRGENAIGVVLGNGRFYSPRSKVYAGMPHYGFPKLLLHLRIEYADGSVSEIVSDESWKLTADGPIIGQQRIRRRRIRCPQGIQRIGASAGFDDSDVASGAARRRARRRRRRPR